jgi:hypothetical protein
VALLRLELILHAGERPVLPLLDKIANLVPGKRI